MLHVPDTPRPANGYPAVVILHGFTGNRAGDHRLLPLLSRELMRRGVASLRFDFRGSGESEGDFSEMTVAREVEDVHAAFRFVRELPDVDGTRVSLLGFSMGGMVAALSAADVQAERLALWAPALPNLWNPSRRDLSTLPDVIDNNGWPMGRAFLAELQHLDPVSELRNFRGAVRVFHGDGDTVVPLEAGRQYAEAANAELVVVDGANHTFDSLGAVRFLYGATVDFLRDSTDPMSA